MSTRTSSRKAPTADDYLAAALGVFSGRKQNGSTPEDLVTSFRDLLAPIETRLLWDPFDESVRSAAYPLSIAALASGHIFAAPLALGTAPRGGTARRLLRAIVDLLPVPRDLGPERTPWQLLQWLYDEASHLQWDAEAKVYRRVTSTDLDPQTELPRFNTEADGIMLDTPIRIVIDVLNLGGINAEYGPYLGDVVLRKVANTLMELSGSRPITRFGGDEFAILVRGDLAEGARAEADELARRIEPAVRLELDRGRVVTGARALIDAHSTTANGENDGGLDQFAVVHSRVIPEPYEP